MQLVIHAPLGGRINKAWGLALRKRFCRSFNFELQAAATDNGLLLSLGEQHSFPLTSVFGFLHSATARHLLEQAALPTPLFTSRWRWDAGRALALPRFQGGRKVPLPIQRMRAEDLLSAVFPEAIACQENLPADIPIPDHPLVRETMNDVMNEALDLDGLRRLLDRIASGSIRTVAIDTASASPFSQEIVNANPYAFLDDAPLEERRARAVMMRRLLPEETIGEAGRLDPAAVEETVQQAWPDVRNAEELHDALVTLVAFPEARPASTGVSEALGRRWQESVNGWAPFFESLVIAKRVTRARLGGRAWWVPAERARTFEKLFPEAQLESAPPAIEASAPSGKEALERLLVGWLGHLGPTNAAELANFVGLPEADIERGMLGLESAGMILRGRFTEPGTASTRATAGSEWCERRLLARIHRATLVRLRREIEPVTQAQFYRWLLRWQHVAPGTQLSGERGMIEVLRQLQGLEAPANAWEPQILARRIAGYDGKLLDRLCLSGAVGWGRLSRRRFVTDGSGRERRVVASSVAPVAFFVREEADWLALVPDATEAEDRLSDAAQEVFKLLASQGASFFADIVRGSGRLKAEVETALWELVAAGRVTADDFDNLRALVDPRRRAGQGRGRRRRPRHSTGRWSVLQAPGPGQRQAAIDSACRMLLFRYGVVFREAVERESILPPWREMLMALRLMEDRGEARGGHFVDGFLGEQFALPMAVESLRASRYEPPSGETVTIAAADPLNLVGVLTPGERVAASTGKFITFRDGVPMRIEDHPPAIALVAG